MAIDRIYCDNCGALCGNGDIFCKSCFSKIKKDPVEVENTKGTSSVIEGIDDTDLSVFIAKNTDYYMDKLADKDDKKHYFQLNWSALCFGSKWYLYRGMMKNVIKYLVYINLISILLLFGIRAMYNADFANYRSASEAYSDFVKYGGQKYLVDENGHNYAINPEYKMLRDARDEAADDFNIVYIVGLAIVFGAEVLFRLSGNCLYRKHIKENIRTGEGGASIGTMIGGIFILGFVERGISILCLSITGVLEIISL